jgi:hypothetical protein
VVTGACRCGAVAFPVDGALADASFRHCGICRRLTNAAFGAGDAAPGTAPTLTHGADDLSAIRPRDSVTRRFRRRCDPLVPTPDAAGPGTVLVRLGTLDDGAAVGPEDHPFAADAAPRHPVTDDLPRHAGWPTD